MGSPCELQLCAPDAAAAERAASAVVAEVERLEARYSRYRASSYLSFLNGVAREGGEVSVDAETAGLLSYADSCHAQSGGLFDISSGILRRAWRFDRGELPDPVLVSELREKVGWQRIVWEPPVLRFPVAGMELDLGGVVKEYAVDRAVTVCHEAGIRSGMINLGGDVRIVGPQPDGTPWRVGIRHPRCPGEVLTVVSLHSGAVATSGDYERCIEHGGVRYGHILHPKTGWPTRHMASVSVVAELGIVAGSVSTIAMLEEERGPAWLAASGLPHLWMNVDGEVGGSLWRP